MAALSTRDLSMFTTSDAGQGQFITLQTPQHGGPGDGTF
jgi:hypothetical protein